MLTDWEMRAMKEKLKTLLLILLVGISVFITSELWIRFPDQVFGKTETPSLEDSSSYLSEIISPNRYLLNFNETNHTLLYDDEKYGIWNNSQKYLGELFADKKVEIQEISKEEYIGYQEKRSVIFYFAENMSTYIFSKIWNVKEPNDIVDTIPNLDSIYIYLDGRDPFFILSNNENHYLVKTSDMDLQELESILAEIDSKKNYPFYYSMRKTLNTDNDIYIPYEMKGTLPKIYVSNGVKSLNIRDRNALAERFLNRDTDYIREIMEQNGSYIYIYEQRFLKLNTNGTIEYFHPLTKRIKDRNLYTSLTYAADFIERNTRIPQDIHLADIEEIESDDSLGYRFMFRYRIRGIPVILGNQEAEEYIQMEVFNNHIKSYEYYAREETQLESPGLTPDREFMSAFDIIDKNYEKFEKIYKNDNSIDDESLEEDQDLVEEVLSNIDNVALAYLDPGLKEVEERLIPVWVIGFSNRLLAFDANNGNLVFERANR